MRNETKQRSAWRGFLTGLLVVLLPVTGYFAYQHLTAEKPTAVSDKVDEAIPDVRSGPAPGRSAVAGTGSPDAFPIDAENLPVSGASLPDASPPVSRQEIETVLRRAEGWLRKSTTDPFSGTGTDSLRLFALEVQCFDRLRFAETDRAKRAILEEETRTRLARILDPVRLSERIGEQGNLQGALEILILAARCHDLELDPSPILPIVEQIVEALETSLAGMPTGIAALFSAQISSLGLDTGTPIERLRAQGTLSRRPREVRMTPADALGLTHEIFAYTDFAHQPLECMTESEQRYLHRVLPQLALTYSVLRNTELCADLLSCTALAGMTETHGYREGIRFLLTRQNDDGGFGDDAAPRSRRLAPVVACLTALSLTSAR